MKIGKVLSIIVSFAMVATVFTIALPTNVKPDGFILHPGYIEGTLSIPGHNFMGRGYAYASGGGYSAEAQIIGGQFTLVVEGGDWPYHITVSQAFDGDLNNRIRWNGVVTVGVNETVYLDIVADATIEGTISVGSGDTQEIVRSSRVSATSGSFTSSLKMFYRDSVTTASDSVGSNDGTLVNGPEWATGIVGGALSFDGYNDYVSIGNMGSFPTVGAVEFWMNPSAVQNYRNPFTTNYNGRSAGIRFEEHSSHIGYTNAFYVVIGNDDRTDVNVWRFGSDQEGNPIQANTWTHVVVTWDTTSNNVKGYWNGVKVIDDSHTGWPTLLPNVAIGTGHSTDPQRQWKGLVDEVAIYNQALTPEDIQQHYNDGLAGLPNPGVDGGMVSYWKLDDDLFPKSLHYSLPLIGSDNQYQVAVHDVKLTDGVDYFRFPPQWTSVAPGGTTTVDFHAMPGYIEGTVTVHGATLSGGTIAAYIPAIPENEGLCTSCGGGSRIASDGTFRFPVIPQPKYWVYGGIGTSIGHYGLEVKIIPPVIEGETTFVDWELFLEGSISGDVAIAGVTIDEVRIYAYGPYGASRTSTLYTEGEYFFDGTIPGEWRIYSYVYDREFDQSVGYWDVDYYVYPQNYIEIAPGQHVTYDLTFTAGFLEGTILSPDSPATEDIVKHYVWAHPRDYYQTWGDEAATTYSWFTQQTENYDLNQYDMFVRPGDWIIDRIELNFRTGDPITTKSTLGVYNYSWMANAFLNISAGETVVKDFNYETATITGSLRVATGEPLSKPRISGRFIQVVDGITANLNAQNMTSDLTEGFVTAYAIPGTYRLTAQAYVQGSWTTFGQPFIVTVEPGDVVITDPDAPTVNILWPPGNYESDSPCVTVQGTVTDESGVASLTINGNTATVNEDDTFEMDICGMVKGENIIEVIAEDVHGNTISIQRTVIVINSEPTAVLGGPYTAEEGTEITLDASGSWDPDGDVLQYRWDFDGDGEWDTEYSDSPTAPYIWDDQYTGTVTVEVYDGFVTSTATTTVEVLNADPSITDLLITLDPTPVGTSVDLSGTFTDPGILDTHTATIDWGDSTTSSGTVIESDGSGTVTADHPYTTPGVYSITLTVEDLDGGSASSTFQYVVVYDPTGQFITGGGQFDSPAGALISDPSITGKAGFGFVSKYQKGATVPGGNTQFRFHAGDISFHSSSYDWLVVTGSKGMFKGKGTINGEGNYGFMISAIDGDMSGGDGVDKFRIKIWDKDTDTIVYDNNLGAGDDADPTTALTHGSIKIHK
ncbi:MAG: hypothetical protein JSV09_12790 [Thermoplasmata archaeon]|nr:MAG: hypothetical protein JSV09_12790 [Thermoplasmata archaeon]